MFEDLFNGIIFFNMLQFDKIDYKKYIESFDDQNEILEIIVDYIKKRERDDVGIFGLYRIDRTVLTTELKECLFLDSGYKTQQWYDFLNHYPVRINHLDFTILKDELAEYESMDKNPYILVISFIPL